MQPNHERQPVAEMKEAEDNGEFLYIQKTDSVDEEEDEEGPHTPPSSPVKVNEVSHSECVTSH